MQTKSWSFALLSLLFCFKLFAQDNLKHNRSHYFSIEVGGNYVLTPNYDLKFISLPENIRTVPWFGLQPECPTCRLVTPFFPGYLVVGTISFGEVKFGPGITWGKNTIRAGVNATLPLRTHYHTFGDPDDPNKFTWYFGSIYGNKDFQGGTSHYGYKIDVAQGILPGLTTQYERRLIPWLSIFGGVSLNKHRLSSSRYLNQVPGIVSKIFEDGPHNLSVNNLLNPRFGLKFDTTANNFRTTLNFELFSGWINGSFHPSSFATGTQVSFPQKNFVVGFGTTFEFKFRK